MDQSPIPVDWRHFRYWLRQTVRNERIHSRGTTSPLTIRRAARMLAPNLRAPVFAIGAPRSGTTFLGNCLSSLPEISYHFEPVVTKAAVRYVRNQLWREFSARQVYRSAYALLMRMSNETDLRFCEKTPGNCFILPFLHRTFSNAKFIHIVRDGRDAALSLSKKPWYRNDSRGSGVRDPDGYYIGPSKRFWVEEDRIESYESTNDLHRCIWLWRCYVESAIAGAKLIPPENYLLVTYEELLREPSKHADTISSFLEIDQPESRKQFRNAIVENASTDSIGKWRSELNDKQKDEMLNEAGRLLQSLGYSV